MSPCGLIGLGVQWVWFDSYCSNHEPLPNCGLIRSRVQWVWFDMIESTVGVV